MRFLRVRDVCRMVGFSKTTLYARLKNGTFPKPVALGPQTVAFVESDVVDWMKLQITQQNAPAENRRDRALRATAGRNQERSHV